MAAVYSARLVAIEGLNGDFLYSVPAGQIAIVRDVCFYSSGGTDFRIIGDAGQTFVYWGGPDAVPPAKEGWHWEGRQVIEAGGTFVVRTVAPGDVTVSGYLLYLP